MIDIIIPTYNNLEGLKLTLNSIPKDDRYHITIIDDCSTQDIDYSDMINQYSFLQMPQNSGPGNVRQYGIEHTQEPYIMFIDTGDYLINTNIFDIINQLPDIDIFSFQSINQRTQKVCPNTHNRMHGRIYKRELINKYHISFCPESPFVNEDIGFNRICRLLSRQGLCKIARISQPLYMWTFDPNSLTHKNNHEFTYKKQNIGLALNGIHIYNTCKNVITPEQLDLEAGEIMGAMHQNVIQVAQECPDCLQYAWRGARLYYEKVYKNAGENKKITLQAILTRTMKQAYNKREQWKKPIPLNIDRFLQDIEKYEMPPSWYKV